MEPIYEGVTFPITLSDFDDVEWTKKVHTRSECFMSDVPREYGYGTKMGTNSYKSIPFTRKVKVVMNVLNSLYGTSYDVCFLNKYDNAKQALGWHSDDSHEIDLTHPIAVVSVGAEREIWWKPKGVTGVIPMENRQVLENGSLYIMPGGFQDVNLHRIPKCDRECGVRISLTFRKFKENT